MVVREEIGEDNIIPRIHQTVDYINQVMSPLPGNEMTCLDSRLIEEEFRLAADLLRHSARRILFAAGDASVTAAELLDEFDQIEERYRRIWLARNRSGGLEDSLRRMRGERALYE